MDIMVKNDVLYINEKSINDCSSHMVRIGNKICSKEPKTPYALLTNGSWILYDHYKEIYYPVKELCGDINYSYEWIVSQLEAWGMSTNGFTPEDGDICMEGGYLHTSIH